MDLKMDGPGAANDGHGGAGAGAGPVRVLHFVTGGFGGGATQMALALVQAARQGGPVEPLLVLRRKRRGDPRRIEELQRAGVPLRVVAGWSHLATVLALVGVCREFRPHVLVAHGFSEHLWGRYAGLLAKVPALVHVEHNTRERYTRWRLMQSRWLARRTQRIVGCSEAVRLRLLDMGMPADRTIAIPNGITLEPFATADAHPFASRESGLVMVARLSKQKDHRTLLQALALLRSRGLRPPALLVGGGKLRPQLERLSAGLGLDDGQVQFLGIRRDVPELLMGHRLCVLSTHYEGMPLALLEGMAAGCAVIGSAVPGVREVIEDGVDGCLVAAADPAALAEAIAGLLQDGDRAQAVGARARERALQAHGRALMNQRYEALFLALAREAAIPAARG
jgi:glycosyltransferase involved in cell wall biosynthesis